MLQNLYRFPPVAVSNVTQAMLLVRRWLHLYFGLGRTIGVVREYKGCI